MVSTVPDPDEVLRRLNRVTQRGPGQWMAECPCHDDRNPSLSITQREDGDGTILVHCFGCDAGYREVCEAIGISTSQLFPGTGRGGSGGGRGSAGRGGSGGGRGSAGRRTQEARYEYVNAAGEPVMRVLRYRDEDGTKAFLQMRYRDGEWEWGAPPPQDRPLYRLPEVLAQVANRGTVYVVEGEKDVETLEGLHAVATTNSGGAGKWLPHHTECLAGATVVVIADRDEVGVGHALHVARELRSTGSAVEVLQPAIGKDVSDHVGAGRGRDELEIVPGAVEDDFTKKDIQSALRTEDDSVSKWVPFDKPSTLSESAKTSIERNLPDVFASHPRAYSKWSPEEDAYLTELQEAGASIKEISSALHRRPGAICSRIRKLKGE